MVPMISPPSAKPTVERTWEPAVQAEQTRLLYRNTALSVGITAVVSSVLCFLQWAVIPHRDVLGWLTYMFLVSLGRFSLWRSFRSRVNLRTARVWGLLFSIGAALSAAGWGAAGLVLYPKDHLTNQVFLAFVLGGMMVGAASVLAASVVDFALFISLSGLPFALRLLSEGDEVHVAMGLLAALYTVATLITGWRVHETIISSLKRAEVAMKAQLIESAITEERNRMAGELHDNLAQGFVGVMLRLAAAREIRSASPDKAFELMDEAEVLASSSLAEARRSVWALRPPELDTEGLAGAVKVFLERIRTSSSSVLEFSVKGNPYPLPKAMTMELLRISQEAVTNALRHADASKIQVHVSYEPSVLRLSVQDNGRGFHSATPGNGCGFGLTNMRERAERIGAQIEIVGDPGHGTRITVVSPLPGVEWDSQ